MNLQENLFGFDYDVQTQLNLDASESRFTTTYGQNGNIIHTGKKTYIPIKTENVSRIGTAFQENGMKVKPFIHRSGEIIGLNIPLTENKLTKIGHKNYSAFITCPNNGSGKGYLSLKEVRLICKNGMVRKTDMLKEKTIKIPHTFEQNFELQLMKESILAFENLMQDAERYDEILNEKKIDRIEAKKLLNRWFFTNEMPDSQKVVGEQKMDFNMFGKILYSNPQSLKSHDRYLQLCKSFELEIDHNSMLGLNLSYYTTFATVTNYLSQRLRASASTRPSEIQDQTIAKKVEFFNQFATV